MPWGGSAGTQTYARTDGTRNGANTWQLADAAGVDIISPDHDTHDQDMADAINVCLKKDGGNTATANLPMGGFRHRNVGAAEAQNEYARLSDVVSDKGRFCATVGGTANAITLTSGYAVTSYVAGQTFTFKSTATNSGPVTVNVDSNGVKNVLSITGAALTGGEIIIGSMVSITYDGTQFIIRSGAIPVALAVGCVVVWPLPDVPAGWLEADGSAVSRTTYAALFAKYGTAYGPGDGSTTFNLPNYKDYFLRGFDASGTDASSRSDRGDGTTGAVVGTKQADAFKSHTHTASVTDPGHSHQFATAAASGASIPTPSAQGGGGSFGAASTNTNTTGITVSNASTGGTETRPKNVTVKFIILASPSATLALGTGFVLEASGIATGGLPARVSTDGNDTTPSASETYIAAIMVPGNCTATGIAVFNGSAAAGNLAVALANSSGDVIASSASTAASGTDAYQRVAFSSAVELYGPATYYVLLQCSSTSHRSNAHTFGAFRTGKKTGETFGTFTSITVPTTFTANVGPIASLYT